MGPRGHVYYQTETSIEREEIEQAYANLSFDNFVQNRFPVGLGDTDTQNHMIKFIQQGGVYMNSATDKYGQMPMEYAVKYQLTAVIAYLQANALVS
jgi:hypothetical protein